MSIWKTIKGWFVTPSWHDKFMDAQRDKRYVMVDIMPLPNTNSAKVVYTERSSGSLTTYHTAFMTRREAERVRKLHNELATHGV